MKHKKFFAVALTAVLALSSMAGMMTAYADEELPFVDPFAPAAEDQQLKENIEIFVSLMNDVRLRNGLSEVYIAPQLCKYSQIRAEELSVFLDHGRPDGRDCFTVLTDDGFDTRHSAENISAGWRDVVSAFGGFMNSPDHYRNMMMNPATHFGLGYVYKPEVNYSHFWQMFIIEKYGEDGNPYIFEGQYIPDRALGDANGTKVIDAEDARRIQEYSSACAVGKTYPVSGKFLYAADVNQDGQINAIDANIVLSYTAQRGVDPEAIIEDFIW